MFCIRIGHSKNVVCLNSLVGSTVAWNWFAKSETSLLLLDAEEDAVCIVHGLTLGIVDLEVGRSVVVEGFCVLLKVLLSYNIIGVVIGTSVEFPDGNGVDWLLQN